MVDRQPGAVGQLNQVSQLGKTTAGPVDQGDQARLVDPTSPEGTWRGEATSAGAAAGQPMAERVPDDALRAGAAAGHVTRPG
ncbi:MAG: hypothetical protein ACRDRD_09555 [Pseudonocardiaceae bacterium]